MSTSKATSFTAGLVQLRSGLHPNANLDSAVKLINEAKSSGADYILTPEMTNILALKREQLFAVIVEEEGDQSLATFRELARKHGVYLHVGSLAIKLTPDKAANRSFLIGRDGEIVARYDKIYMFDVDLANGESYRESRNYRPGEIAVVADLPWGRLGLSVCYDLRFPTLYRALAEAGSSFLAIPSAFTKQTGEAHWHVLMRARAIENGSFVLAAAQGGRHENGRDTFGHSLVVDPWGRIIAEAGTEPGVVLRQDRPGRSGGRAREGSLPSARAAVRDYRTDRGAHPAACCRSADMIRYALACDQGHNFESWFQNSAAYDKQVKRGLVTCPACGSPKVEKALMAPRLSGVKKRRSSPPQEAPTAAPDASAPQPEAPAPVAMMSPQEREFRTKLKELRDHLTKNADYVGQKFPEEARKMHYGEIDHRSIYGEASPDQAKELHEEGIEFHPLPVLPEERN